MTIHSIKPGDIRKRLSDGDGLYLRLFVKGSAHGWRLDYTINGVRKNLSLGTYPATGMALARDKADKARALVAAGIDPSDNRKADKAAQVERRQAEQRQAAGLPGAGSFEAVARDWLAVVHSAKVSAGHAERTRIRFEQDVFPWLGARPGGRDRRARAAGLPAPGAGPGHGGDGVPDQGRLRPGLALCHRLGPGHPQPGGRSAGSAAAGADAPLRGHHQAVGNVGRRGGGGGNPLRAADCLGEHQQRQQRADAGAVRVRSAAGWQVLRP